MKNEATLNFPNGIFDSKYLVSLFDSKSVYNEINKLLKDNMITRIGRGQYIAVEKKEYGYTPSEELLKIERCLLKEFNELDFRIGELYQLNWFTNHQIAKNVIIVETEKMLTESVFYVLKEKFHVLLKPDMNDLTNYVQNGTVIVQNLVTGAPKTEEKHVVSLEKLLVDIVCDKKYTSFIQKAEIREIYDNAFETYKINRAAMLRYAGRRSCKEEIVKLLENI